MRYWLPILSGICIGTSYIPLPPWAILFAYVPLWIWWLKQERWSRVFWGGWWTQFILTLIGFNWVAHTLKEFGHLPWPAAIVALFLFAGFGSLHVPLSGVLWWFFQKRLKVTSLGARLALLAAFAILTEKLYPMIFDWHLGYTLLYLGWPQFILSQWIGFAGLSALIFTINAYLAYVYCEVRETKRRWLWLSALSSFVVVLNVLGWMISPAPDLSATKARVLVVQANIGNSEKQEAEYHDSFRDIILQTYLDQTDRALKDFGPLDFVVWPETAFPYLLNEPYLHANVYSQRLRHFLQERQLSLVTGGYGMNPINGRILNSIYTLNSSGELTSTPYSKTHLLAFGEYFPFADWFPKLREWFPEVGEFERGLGPSIQELGPFKLGPIVCYEGLFADHVRDLANRGAQLLINVTNDSWYGKWQQPWQHLYMTMARAVEVQRPLVRSTNTGFTTVALPNGRHLALSPLHEVWSQLYEIPYQTTPPATFYMGAGFYFDWILALLLILGAWIKRERN